MYFAECNNSYQVAITAEIKDGRPHCFTAYDLFKKKAMNGMVSEQVLAGETRLNLGSYEHAVALARVDPDTECSIKAYSVPQLPPHCGPFFAKGTATLGLTA